MPRINLGRIGDYPPSGHTVVIPQQGYDTEKWMLQCMRESGFVARNTRYVQVDTQVMNFETKLMATLQINFEFSATGRVLPELKVFMLRRPRYSLYYE